ncbi:Inner membrane amino-acid ABC transporter permease protein YhdY [Acaryochloris thomasi RCC1774]|uniref:Inner membrane amino-acid ABC transporter permease protein YhdY n=1 Tax=Acaryochloris thomasi RCC1774 TaxID=1764569 RepID=A0A2W1JI56_9CYAN|nr:amino acid ABC transporter permease [Acaryochloris thomasi]PZD73200.1 Inner membrane amino-acid ABC transporter permease protein YhdY [Acaryochloris thomasi RCC1774]
MKTLPSPEAAWLWLRRNLFSTWYNVVLTLLCIWVLVQGSIGFIHWTILQAQWSVISVNLRLFLVGRFPITELWRVWGALCLVVAVVSLSWGVVQQFSRQALTIMAFALLGSVALAALWQADSASLLWILMIGVTAVIGYFAGGGLRSHLPPGQLNRGLPLLWFSTFLVVVWLLSGGLGLTPVPTNLWNGLLLTLLMAALSIVLSFPLGVLLALGRRSDLPIIRTLSILYIEVIRGLPLIGVLFMAQVMLPLVLPAQLELDAVVRAIAGLTLFSAAYLAENVRGGLQSVPKGQTEAAQVLGLNPMLTLGLVVLPQALRAVIPAIVGQFIGLFKDTSLLSIVGLVELTGIARSILSQPDFLGRYAEVYLVIGLVYFGFCYLMSLASRRLEQQLGS